MEQTKDFVGDRQDGDSFRRLVEEIVRSRRLSPRFDHGGSRTAALV